LAEQVLEFCNKALKQGGSCVIKISNGGTEKQFADKMKKKFANIRLVKPAASRQQSTEFYLLGKHFQNTASI
jgi:23S rRNA (uridine2552-2'-O)-methyltransferase